MSALRPGYKQTDLGVVPEEWGVAFIEDHAQITTGSRNTQDRIEDGQYPFFVRSQDVERINSYSFDGEAVLTAGDGVGTGKIFHYIVGKFDVHQRVYQMSNFNEGLNGRYFFRVFSTRFYDRIMAMTAKSSVDSVRREMIARMKIPLPPLPEQQAIAEALGDADALIEALEALIAKKHDIKQGAMQELLTGHRRLPGFQGEWTSRNLEELAQVYDGTHQTPSYVADGIPFYSVEHVTSGDFANTKYISESEHKFLTRFVKIEKGDVLMTRIGSIGDCKLVDWDVDASFYVSLALIKCDTELSAEFLVQYSGSNDFRAEIDIHSLAHAVPKKINLGPIGKIKIVLPPTLDEQRAIAAVLLDMDAEIAALEAKLAKALDVKQGMMQVLLTGEIRLV